MADMNIWFEHHEKSYSFDQDVSLDCFGAMRTRFAIPFIRRKGTNARRQFIWTNTEFHRRTHGGGENAANTN